MTANARSNAPGWRLRQLERVLLLIELLAPLRCGARLPELTDDLNDTLGTEYCERTVRRDLAALERLGLVEPVVAPPRYKPGPVCPRWRWTDRSVRGAICRHVAELQAAGRERMSSEAAAG